MSDDTKTNSSQKLIEAIRGFDDDHLVDVLRLWDCYTQSWYDESTILLRFESDDLLVYADDSGWNFKVGPVDTDISSESSVAINDLVAVRDHCLCWRYTCECQDLIGINGADDELIRRIAQSDIMGKRPEQ